ncbi:GTP cyclohydrolase II [Pseudooctadecabacter jejudonensis]|uniref:GTP cyclohydrolase-2 n=1 Tax=Pseudooctadecabacter jejudonensis TaxID=1391910 RepID=A0A1Y5S9F8_9RHOB|nr:GTP cyclohydrolase II [Pseudooctadecabacter jejudonensis]SLN35498.1 GTP cyclohydrolase-2 [Pseudooctadecabacter jejudonensis]
MSISPDTSERISRARGDLRMGVPVVLSSGLVFCAIEVLTESRFNALRGEGSDPVIAITSWRAQTIKATAYDGDIARIALPKSATRTWVASIADPAGDLNHPMKGPLKTLRDGPAGPHRAAIALTKAAHLLPAVLTIEVANPRAFALNNNLTFLPEDAITSDTSPLHRVVHAGLPMDVSEAGRLHIFRPDDGGEEHYAVEIGHPDRSQPVLSRLHSACFTGDVLGSLKCDCGPQLRAALMQMGAEGSGVLLYLNQEGRGIGLANKMRAYSLQDQGFDTVEANHRLGFNDDERDFRIGAEILRQMGFSQVRLLTNNPAKVARLEGCGLSVVERVPLHVGENPLNASYIATKAAKSGHLF